MAEKEIRSFELRVGQSQGDEFALVGYACRFNSPSKPIPTALSNNTFIEKILPGSFTKVLATNPDVKCLYNHDAEGTILGRTKSGTLTLIQDDKGLRFRCQLDKNSQAHRDLYASVLRHDLDECSFAFSVDDRDDDSWTTDEKGNVLRTIRNFKGLFDVSIVGSPAYEGTSVAARTAINLNEDALLRARAQKLGHDIEMSRRYGASGAGPGDAGFGRNESGQSGDPQQLLRCPGQSLTSNRADHIEAAEQHRCIATRCKRADRADLHYRASEAHKAAAFASPDDESLFAETCGRAVVACQRAHDYDNAGAE
jgi:HK97 family phage prohead protease